jgi:hypothetical protein
VLTWSPADSAFKDQISAPEVQAPESFLRVYPNPFNLTATIFFSLQKPGQAVVLVNDLLGREVKVLHQGFLNAGEHKRHWNGTNGAGRPVGSGMYLISFKTNEQFFNQKILLMK